MGRTLYSYIQEILQYIILYIAIGDLSSYPDLTPEPAAEPIYVFSFVNPNNPSFGKYVRQIKFHKKNTHKYTYFLL